MSAFWVLEAGLTQHLPVTLYSELARFRMGEKVTVDFPDQWRRNLVENIAEPRATVPDRQWEWDELRVPLERRLEDALAEISLHCSALSVRDAEWLTEVQALASEDVHQIIIGACIKHGVTPEDLLVGASQSMIEY